MRLRSVYPVFIFLFCWGQISLAQFNVNALLVSAEKQRQAYNFSTALKIYGEVLAQEQDNVRALDGIIDIYLYDFELFDSARVYLEKRIQVQTPDTNYLIYYKYADCLRMLEEQTMALDYYYFYRSHTTPKGKSAERLFEAMNTNVAYCQNALNNKELIYEPYKVENMGYFINSIEGEYTPVFIESDSLLLYNARYKDYEAEIMSDDNKYFENIYYFDLTGSVASTFNPDIDQKNHVAVVSRTYGGDTVLVCYKNVLWTSSYGADRITSLISLPVPLNGYYFQPHGCFSADNRTFVFSAKAENDNLDLYISYFNGTSWSNPKPISLRINSGMDEDGPWLSADAKTLYFSSKGHNSSGGYDFFVSHLVNGEWSAPQNMGYPMNSAGDDIYISWNSDSRGGFFSSNRAGGYGGMDIYSFNLLRKTITGVARDKEGNLLSGVSVELKNKDTGESIFATSDGLGKYSFLVDPEQSFTLKGTKEDYFDGMSQAETFGTEGIFQADLILEKDPGLSLYLLVLDKASQKPLDSVKIKVVDNMTGKEEYVMTSLTGDYLRPLPDKKLNERGSYNFTIEKDGYLAKTVTYNVLFDKEGKFNVHEALDISIEKVEVGQDLSKIVQLNPIYFDVGKWNIRPDAAVELDKIVKVMNDNPRMVIELGSHTDSRGNAKSNQTLSDKRAKSSAEYIRQRITNPERITGVGYGESKPVNDCIDGVNCPEEKHQENRRTEFIIISM